MPILQSPYPYFGGKSRVADLVWARFGVVRNYVEPFFGSGALLLARRCTSKPICLLREDRWNLPTLTAAASNTRPD